MEEAEGAPRVEERHQEQQTERQPDVRGVHLLGDGARIAAGERSVQLLVVPCAQHLAGLVVDDRLGDLGAAARETR